jgi:23S rRNA (cytosine1962-C5)-methyltransferase
LENTNAFRLIHGESDGLPGLIVDLYDNVAVVQLLSAGPELWKESIFRGLIATLGDIYLYERSDADVRTLEGLPPRVGPILKSYVPTELIIREHSLMYKVNISSGHKTGFYLDQRDNRLVARNLSLGKDILDCFCYTGGFSLNAWVGNARSITAVDESEEALFIFAENLRLNQASSDNITTSKGDVFQLLRHYRDSNRSFDMIILDPPKFAPTRAQVERASRGYKDINLLAMKLLRENGILLTFSCSGGVSLDLFTKIISGAAFDSGQDFQILAQLHQAADHPFATNFPEGAYLKGLILKRI